MILRKGRKSDVGMRIWLFGWSRYASDEHGYVSDWAWMWHSYNLILCFSKVPKVVQMIVTWKWSLWVTMQVSVDEVFKVIHVCVNDMSSLETPTSWGPQWLHSLSKRSWQRLEELTPGLISGFIILHFKAKNLISKGGSMVLFQVWEDSMGSCLVIAELSGAEVDV